MFVAPTLLLADDHPVVVQALDIALRQALPRAHLVHALNAGQIHAALPSCDAALIDLHMPGMARGQHVARLVASFPRVRLVLISGQAEPAIVGQLLALPSVYAFVPKSAPPIAVIAALQAALRGEKLGALPEGPHVHAGNDADGAELPPRLAQIRMLLRQGKTNKDIAAELQLSVGTVKNYLSELYQALHVSNRVQATLPGPHD